jgi:hypothetical protein
MWRDHGGEARLPHHPEPTTAHPEELVGRHGRTTMLQHPKYLVVASAGRAFPIEVGDVALGSCGRARYLPRLLPSCAAPAAAAVRASSTHGGESW